MTDVKYWVAFNIVQGIGPMRVQSLLEFFKDLEAAWKATPLELARAGLDRRSISSVTAARGKLDLDAEMGKIARLGVTVLTWDDESYPARLRQIHAAPPVLYLRGTVKPEDEWAVGVVGTRTPNHYGLEITRQLATDLARARVTVVSGLARGIDAAGHHAALEAGGRTLAVLGSGLDEIYPPENRRLAQRIVEQGALISEYPLGTRPEARNFPPRNRIISGLSLGVLVVQGTLRSGARITAEDALEQDREVFAVPGDVLSRNSELPNQLIQKGAKMVMKANDILEELNLTMVSQHAEARAALPQTNEEAALLRHLSTEPQHVDQVSRASGLPIQQVTSLLAMMELKGLVRQTGGMRYASVREETAPYRSIIE
jgi:DNA processing protein